MAHDLAVNETGTVHLRTVRTATRNDAIALLESGFRNIELPPLSEADLRDIQDWLDRFVRDEPR